MHKHNRRVTWKWDSYIGIKLMSGQAQVAVTEFSNMHSEMKEQNWSKTNYNSISFIKLCFGK